MLYLRLQKQQLNFDYYVTGNELKQTEEKQDVQYSDCKHSFTFAQFLYR